MFAIENLTLGGARLVVVIGLMRAPFGALFITPAAKSALAGLLVAMFNQEWIIDHQSRGQISIGRPGLGTIDVGTRPAKRPRKMAAAPM
jgi:hypothetical protein